MHRLAEECMSKDLDNELDPDSNNLDKWEGLYQADTFPWDRGMAHPSIPILLSRETSTHPPINSPVLVPGCGRANDARGFASAGIDCIGMDLSPTGLAMAAAAGVPEHLQLIEGDALSPAEAYHGLFQTVWEHTFFCAIHPEQHAQYAKAMHQVLQPGGQLIGIFFVQDSPSVSGPPFTHTQAHIEAVFAPWFTLVAAVPPPAGFEGREDRECLMTWKRLDA